MKAHLCTLVATCDGSPSRVVDKVVGVDILHLADVPPIGKHANARHTGRALYAQNKLRVRLDGIARIAHKLCGRLAAAIGAALAIEEAGAVFGVYGRAEGFAVRTRDARVVLAHRVCKSGGGARGRIALIAPWVLVGVPVEGLPHLA